MVLEQIYTNPLQKPNELHIRCCLEAFRITTKIIFSKLMKTVILLNDPKLNQHLSNKTNFPQPTSASILIPVSNVLQNQAFQNVS